MEPRPSRPSRATGQSTPRTSRTPWTQQPPAEPQSAPRTADIYGAPPGQGGQWYGQPGIYAPDPDEYRNTTPLKPIKPRNERGNKLLRYLLASLLLIGVIGGGAYGITRYLSGDDKKPDDSTFVAMTDASPTAPAATEITEVAQTEPTATVAEMPTVTTEPDESRSDGDESSAATTSDTPTTEAGTSVEISSSSNSAESADAFLPPASELGPDWEISGEGGRTKSQVADAIGSNGDELLTQWGWKENVYRDLTRLDPDSFPEETTFVSVSVHRFDNEQGAADALQTLADVVVEAQGLQDIETPIIGDGARGLSGVGNGVNLYVLYLQDGDILIRLGGASTIGDPADTINNLGQELVANYGVPD